MFRNWIQIDITGHMVTRSSTVTQASLVQLVGNRTSKLPPIITLWEVSNKIKNVIQVNDRLEERE